MNDLDEDKHTHNQLEKILIRSEAEPTSIIILKNLLSSGSIDRCKVSTALVSDRWFIAIIIIFVIVIPIANN